MPDRRPAIAQAECRTKRQTAAMLAWDRCNRSVEGDIDRFRFVVRSRSRTRLEP
jgi:hypothetical protein